MLYIKEFSKERVILSNGKEDTELVCSGQNQEFDRDLLEDILDYPQRVKEEDK